MCYHSVVIYIRTHTQFFLFYFQEKAKNFTQSVTNLVPINSLGCVPFLAIVAEHYDLSYVLKSWRAREI